MTPRANAARTRAQAKLNLFLRVLAREATGYHQLETLFCRLDVADEVVVRTNVRGRSLDCAGDLPAAGLGPTERNLAWRAAAAYAAATGWPNDWAIELTKRVPAGGGLGGGSADAGAVLRCLDALAPTPLSGDALLALATPLGADVSFLTLDAPLALAWGRGERLLRLPPLPAREVTLACFDFGVPTIEAYGWLAATRRDVAPTADVIDLQRVSSWHAVAARAHNDFEAVVAPRYAPIAAALQHCRAAARGSDAFALLAGSGATVAFVSAAADDHERIATALERAVGPTLARLVRTSTATHVVGVELAD